MKYALRRLVVTVGMMIVSAAGVRAQGVAMEPPTLGVRYFRITSATDTEYRGDAKALASSLRIALDTTKGFKQIVTLDDEQIEQLTKLIADSKKGAFNRQLPGNLAELPDAYVFPELLRAGAVERDMFARIEITYTVEMGAAAVDPVTRAILFSDKVTISEKRNKTDTRGGAKNVYEDLVAKAVDRLAAKLAAFFLKRGRVLRADAGSIFINLGSRHGIKAGTGLPSTQSLAKAHRQPEKRPKKRALQSSISTPREQLRSLKCVRTQPKRS